jgi:hypothetical protein
MGPIGCPETSVKITTTGCVITQKSPDLKSEYSQQNFMKCPASNFKEIPPVEGALIHEYRREDVKDRQNLTSSFMTKIEQEEGKRDIKAIPLQAWAGPESSRSLRLTDFKTIGT